MLFSSVHLTVLRFQTDEISSTANDIDESEANALKEKHMRFLMKPCVNGEHSGDLLLDKVRVKSKVSGQVGRAIVNVLQ